MIKIIQRGTNIEKTTCYNPQKYLINLDIRGSFPRNQIHKLKGKKISCIAICKKKYPDKCNIRSDEFCRKPYLPLVFYLSVESQRPGFFSRNRKENTRVKKIVLGIIAGYDNRNYRKRENCNVGNHLTSV